MTKGMAYIIVGLFAAITGIYLLFIRKKTKSTNNITTSDSLNVGAKDTATGTDSVTTENTNPTVINIVNPKLRISPMIGTSHVMAIIEVNNPPQAGNLVIQIGNVYLNQVSLPLLNNRYELDEYVTLPATLPMYNLTAKIDSVIKTVQVSF